MTRELRGRYIKQLAEKHGWTDGVELGVWYGQTYFHLLESLPELTLIGVDDWRHSMGAAGHHTDQQENRRTVFDRIASFGERAKILETTTQEAAALVPDGSLDFVFIDADHSYEAVKADVQAWFPKLKPAGWIIGHDFLSPDVHRAVNELLAPVACPSALTDETWARRADLRRATATVCCLKVGDKYGAEYVNRLYRMVQRNVHLESFDFACFTDDPSGIDPWIRTEGLPYDAPGWWGKMGLYKKRIPGVATNRLLFLDLDVAITGSLDEILAWPAKHAMIRDWPEGRFAETDPRNGHGNSSVILLECGSRTALWNSYVRAKKPTTGSQQGWVNEHFPESFELFPDNLMKSYKLHGLQKGFPPSCRVVMFHGDPKPHECGGWVERYWK